MLYFIIIFVFQLVKRGLFSIGAALGCHNVLEKERLKRVFHAGLGFCLAWRKTKNSWLEVGDPWVVELSGRWVPAK